MSWVPPDISEACRDAQAQLTQCTSTGYMFLALVAQLFGHSLDRQNDFSSSLYSGFEPLTPTPVITYEAKGVTGISAPGLQDLSIPVPVTGFESVTSSYGSIGTSSVTDIFLKPVLSSPYTETVNMYAKGTDGSRGVAKTSFYRKKTADSPEVKFSFETEMFGRNPHVKTQRKRPRDPFEFDLPINLNNDEQFLKPISADFDKIVEEVDNEFYSPQSFGIGEFASASEHKMKKMPSEPPKSGKRRSKRQTIEERYDFIVVGAGSAGCVIANRLSEVKSWKVLLLEAGDEEPEVASVPALAPMLGVSSIDWGYSTQPEPLTCTAQRGRTCNWLRGKVMGGSSAINYLVYMRGNRRDYDEWAEAGNYGWSYKDVLPYFKKSENNQDIEGHDTRYHAVGGYLNVERFPYIDKNVVMIVDGFKEKGLPLTDFNAEQQIGTMTTQTTSRYGRRNSANVAFIRPIRNKRPNLTIRTQSEVTKVLIDPHTKTAYGVKYFRYGRWHYAYSKKEVILSAGSLNSPKILMLSGIGPAEQLQSLSIATAADLRVGYNLQDHVTTDALVFAISNKTSTMIDPQQLPEELYYYHNLEKKNGPLAATGPLFASAFIQTEYSAEGPDIPDIQFHFDGRNLQEFYSDPTTYLSTNIFPLSFYNALAARPILLRPKSRGFITLNLTNPVFGPPVIYPRFFTSKVDVDTMIAAMRYSVSLEDTQTFRLNGARYVRYPVEACAQYAWGTDEYFTCLLTSYTSTIFHPVGTCKMGPHWDKEAVVDPRLNVYGINNLRVADGSIMPSIVRGNTNAPIMMIGEKVADMIKSDWIVH